MRMKNRSAGRFMRQLAATALCAALVTAAMGMAVPAQSPEEEEAAGYAVEAEESDSQGAQASDFIIEDGAEEDEDALYDDGGMQEGASSEEEDGSLDGMEEGDGSISRDEDNPQTEGAQGTEDPEDVIEEDSDGSDAPAAEEAGEEIEADEELEEESSAAGGAAEEPVDGDPSETPDGGAEAADPVLTGSLAPAKLTYTGQAQELVLLSSPAEGTGSAADGKLCYSLDGEQYGEAVPTGTDAGEYTVYYRLMSADGLTILYEGSLTVTIEKADVIFTPPTANTAEGA